MMLADLQKRAESAGMTDVRLVMQDPTDPSRITLIGRKARSATRDMGQSPIVIEKYQEVEDPPTWPAVHALAISGDGLPVETGLSDDEARAVAVALASERNPRHLEGFAHTLDPFFPVAASLLRRQAILVEPGADVRPDEGSVDLAAVGRARASLKSGLPTELLNIEIKRAASALSQGETPTNIPMGILDLGAKTLRKTHTCLAALADSPTGEPRGMGQSPIGTRAPVYVVDVEAMTLAAPPTGKEDFVSPTSLQLALAAGKPKVSGVARFEKARSLFAELETGNVPPEDRMQLLLARSMLEKAQRALERRRWVEWYRKQV
jgi:hypothetical protein